MIHVLKTDKEPFQAIADGRKTFEFRKDDRGYAVSDILQLREIDGVIGNTPLYTGRFIETKITYILRSNLGRYGVPSGYCVMSISKLGGNV